MPVSQHLVILVLFPDLIPPALSGPLFDEPGESAHIDETTSNTAEKANGKTNCMVFELKRF